MSFLRAFAASSARRTVATGSSGPARSTHSTHSGGFGQWSRYRIDFDVRCHIVNSLRKHRKTRYHTDYHDVGIAERRSRQPGCWAAGNRSVIPVRGDG